MKDNEQHFSVEVQVVFKFLESENKTSWGVTTKLKAAKKYFLVVLLICYTRWFCG